jgi:RNA polymerase sigma-70 factor, ECF subfamily
VNTALEKAWEDVASNLRGYIRSRVSDHAAAEDILQDVFLKAHRRGDQLASVNKIEGWLFLITRNAVIDYYRKTKPSEELPDNLVQEEEKPEFECAEKLRQAFKKMVFNLPEPYREALILTEFDGLTQKQLAERLGISLSGAKSRVQRGKEKLKQSLLECCRFEFDTRGKVIECEPKQVSCCTTKK